MSYDVVLQRFEHGEAAAVDSAEVWALLEDAWDAPPDEFNYCLVRRDEDEGDLYAVQPGQPIDSLMFNHAGRAIYHLMFDVAAAGDMAIIQPDVGPFLVRDEQRGHLPGDLSRRTGHRRSLRRGACACDRRSVNKSWPNSVARIKRAERSGAICAVVPSSLPLYF